jgi:integrase
MLSVLSTLLKKAVEWNVIDRVPCMIKLLRVPKPSASFHDFADFERLVTAAAAIDPRATLIVLLGAEAGLRAGEMIALEWGDVDLAKRQLCVERSEWRGHVTSPKGGRLRYVPLTVRLAAALRAARHLRGPRVLTLDDGTPLPLKAVQRFVKLAARRAGLKREGVHVLRHTFCSHLAMRGAPARAIQQLAGHANLTTTQGYMHLSPAAIEGAIRLLDQAAPLGGRGDEGETASGAASK